MTMQSSVNLDADNTRQRLEAAFIRLRHLMHDSSDLKRHQYHGMAQGVLIAMHAVMLIDDAVFDSRTADLASEL